MPGTNAGTGKPLTLKCAKCKLQHDTYWDPIKNKHDWTAKSGRIVRTGRIRGRDRDESHGRMLLQHHEYECLDCGHVGWTRHRDILHKPFKK